MLIILSCLAVLLLSLSHDFQGMTVGWAMVVGDFFWWWHNDQIPVVTNPDAFSSTYNSPWYGKGGVA